MQEAKAFLRDESSMSSFVIQHRAVVSDPDNTTGNTTVANLWPTDYDSEVEVGRPVLGPVTPLRDLCMYPQF